MVCKIIGARIYSSEFTFVVIVKKPMDGLCDDMKMMRSRMIWLNVWKKKTLGQLIKRQDKNADYI